MTPVVDGATSGGTRERLIVAAGQHLAARGTRAVELRAICVELGISPSLVNYHFQSPEQLLWLAAIRAYGQHVHSQQELVATSGTGADAVEAIKTNSEFAYWITVVGFASQGAGMWIAGRKPYSPLWRAFGFSPDKQIRTTVQELIARMAKTPTNAIPDPDTLTDEEE